MSYAQRRRFLWILLFAALVLLAVVANATTLARMRFEDLARQATAVARVRCLGAQSYWEDREIWTDTRFAVLEQAKGSLPEFIHVRMLGGSVGGLHSRVEEVPTFRLGEEAYVFLWAREGEPFRVLGWSQGTFRIRRDERTGAETVTQDSAAAPIFDPTTRQFRHGGIRNLPVAIFQLKLKKALGGSAP
ncbi:MAG TPA: hypothetical protein VE263_02665 [Candidatus Angelobacter sp.]|nr:hypothetical protein [Candidatus Angelobacter sp.]